MFNWRRSFQVTLWIILQSADTKEHKHRRSRSPIRSLSLLLQSQKLKKVSAAEGATAVEVGDMISQTKCQHTLHLLSPYIHRHTHRESWLWPLKVQLGWAQVTKRALMPDGNSRTLAFTPRSAGFTLLPLSFDSHSSNKHFYSKSDSKRKSRASMYCMSMNSVTVQIYKVCNILKVSPL